MTDKCRTYNSYESDYVQNDNQYGIKDNL